MTGGAVERTCCDSDTSMSHAAGCLYFRPGLGRNADRTEFPAPPRSPDPLLVMALRLDSVRRDAVGCTATFFGKPDVHGNSVSVPISEAGAVQLKPGEQYMFALVELNLPKGATSGHSCVGDGFEYRVPEDQLIHWRLRNA